MFLSLRNESSSFDFRRARIVIQTDREDDAPRVPVMTAAVASSYPSSPPLYSYARPTNPVAALRNIILYDRRRRGARGRRRVWPLRETNYSPSCELLSRWRSKTCGLSTRFLFTPTRRLIGAQLRRGTSPLNVFFFFFLAPPNPANHCIKPCRVGIQSLHFEFWFSRNLVPAVRTYNC